MRPAPLLIALIAGWGLAGLAVPFLGWPLWQWQLAGGAMLFDEGRWLIGGHENGPLTHTADADPSLMPEAAPG